MGLGSPQMEKFTKALKVILGLFFLTVGILSILKWKDAFWTLLTGGAGLVFLLIGIIILVISKE